MPITFSDLPLTFILILSDSLQEYLRWEGLSIRGNTKLTGFPLLEVNLIKPDKIKVICSFSIEQGAPHQKYFCEEICRMASLKGLASPGTSVKDCASTFCSIISTDMHKKIQFQDNFQFDISFYVSGEHIITESL